ncbi:hypothetical protein HDV04_000794 [Boothiomyces sp. JEL0838]|nr:hypothetical protein HDV04_000794 [Boothiomyces sp. JEL0838]
MTENPTICTLELDPVSNKFYGSYTPITAQYLKKQEFDHILNALGKGPSNNTQRNPFIINYLYAVSVVISWIGFFPLIIPLLIYVIAPFDPKCQLLLDWWLAALVYGLIAGYAIYPAASGTSIPNTTIDILQLQKSFVLTTCAALTSKYSFKGIELKVVEGKVYIVFCQQYLDLLNDKVSTDGFEQVEDDSSTKNINEKKALLPAYSD